MKLRVLHESRGHLACRSSHGWAVALVVITVLLLVPAGASAASPVLEFVAPGNSLPIPFTTEGGTITAEMAGFEILVHCTASEGEGEITGPRSTVSKYRFTGCKAGLSQKCKSVGAQEEEITAGPIDGDLVYINQAKHEVGILLNPSGGTYISFECGGESAEGKGPFLASVSPINQQATSFTAALNQANSVQTPDEYENASGQRLAAIPTGKKGSNKSVPTGVELAMTVHPTVPVEIKAISSEEIEAQQSEEEITLLRTGFTGLEEAVNKSEAEVTQLHAGFVGLEEVFKKYEEHAKQEATKHTEEADAQIAAAVKKEQEAQVILTKEQEEASRLQATLTRTQSLARSPLQCEKQQSKRRRARCVASANKRYGAKAASTDRRRRTAG